MDADQITEIPVTTCNRLRTKILNEYDIRHGWREVGALWGISGGLAYRIGKQGYEPKSPEMRKKLGLPCLCEVEVIGGDVLPRHTQTLGARTCCKCGRAFIPNAATRHKCFICSPFRRGKK